MVDWKRTLTTLSTLTSRPQFYVRLLKQQYAKLNVFLTVHHELTIH